MQRTTRWGTGVKGLAKDTFPNPKGWKWNAADIHVNLDDIPVIDGYACFLHKAIERPNCETNWERYVTIDVPWEEVWASFRKPGIFAPHHYMTFFKVLHRALPTMTRFPGSGKCRLNCGCTEKFVHLLHCKHLHPYWKEIVDLLNSLGCGLYRLNRPLIYFTLRRKQGKYQVVNRHVKGILWLAWKFAWQQIAEIGKLGAGAFSPEAALTGVVGMHHTAVLAALHDYGMVQQLKRAGGRKRHKAEQEEAERYRVWPFVTIAENGGMRYTSAYHDLLTKYKITRGDLILPPS